MNCKRTLVTLIAMTALSATAGAQTFRVTDLRQVLSGCVGKAINDRGVVAATCPDGVVTWNAGAITRFGKLTGGNSADATAINSLGTVVGDGDTGNFRPNPFITVNGRLLDVDPISGGNARAVGVMDNGVVFGNLTKSLSGNTASWNVVMWTVDPGHPDRYRENILPKYPGGDAKLNGVYATASNKVGQAVGWVTTTLIGQLGGLWNNDAAHSVVALAALDGGNHSIAWGMNDLGQAVGESNTLQTTMRAVMWQNDAAHTVVDLGTLPGDTVSQAQYINSAGQILGFSQPDMSNGPSRIFFYQNGAMSDLSTLIDPLDGFWTISGVYGINNAGQIIAMGSSGGVSGPVVLTPAQ